MATIVEKSPQGIIYRTAKSHPVPDLDVLTLLFGECCSEAFLASKFSHIPLHRHFEISIEPRKITELGTRTDISQTRPTHP
jgi:hypothetical protein